MTLKRTTLVLCLGLVGCQQIAHEQQQRAIPMSDGHIQLKQHNDEIREIPQPVMIAPDLPPPSQKSGLTHTVVVTDVPAKELLFSIARDTELNLDIDESVGNTLITMNAVKQPLHAILRRVADAADLRITRKGRNLRVRKNTPYLETYSIDYLNLQRALEGVVNVSTEIDSTGGKGIGSSSGSGQNDNSSKTAVTNKASNDFWTTLTRNIATILGNPNTKSTSKSLSGHPDIMINRESGIIAIRAKARQHKEIKTFIDRVINSSQRQVLIEATIAEVTLNDTYKAGIDWSLIDQSGDSQTNISQQLTDFSLFARPSAALQLSNFEIGANAIQATIRALKQFGDVQIMSSPKVMALNNQTALLKVVDNLVYFNIDVDIQRGTQTQGDTIIYETQVNTVPVGFVMGVTPYINEQGSVTLNVRPTISRVIGRAADPNPALAEAQISNTVPIIQVREVESILKVTSGEVAVIGGLMQDDTSDEEVGVPVISSLPVVGELFKYTEKQRKKTELVIFIRPRVIDHTQTSQQLNDFEQYIPD